MTAAEMMPYSEPVAYTIDEFCFTHKICRSKLYQHWKNGTGPSFFYNGARRIIPREAAQAFRTRGLVRQGESND
jgi:hypothetical protein